MLNRLVSHPLIARLLCLARARYKAIAGAIAAGAVALAARYKLPLPVGAEAAIAVAVGYLLVYGFPKNVECKPHPSEDPGTAALG